MKSVTLYLLFAVYLQLRYGDAVTTTYRVANDGYIFRNLLLTEVGSLIVGSNLTLERLSGDLEMLQSVNLPAGQPNRLLVGDPGGTYGGSFLACVRMNCELLNVNDITDRRWISTNVLQDGSFNARGLFVPGPDGSSVLTVSLQNDVDLLRASTIRRGSFSEADSDFTVLNLQAELSPFITREFLAVFQHQGFSYYVSKMTIDSVVQTRVVRICNNDTTADTNFESYFEIQLECGEMAVPTAATFNSFDSTIAVSVVTDTENVVCVYELSLINQLMFDKYNSCRYGEGVAGLARQMTFPCVLFDEDRLNNANINECNLVSTLLPSQEMTTPLSADPLLSLPLSEYGPFSSLVHSSLDNVQFLFAGTLNGAVHQFHYVDRNETRFIRSSLLVNQSEVDIANITQMVVSSDGLTLYALSPRMLVSQEVDMCDMFKSCDSCLGNGSDPICGWCVLENRCSRNSTCTGGEEGAVWVSDGTGSCPSISSADPDIIYLRELQTGNVEIELVTDNIPSNVADYQCCYGFPATTSQQHATTSDISMETMFSMATRNGNRFTCPVPSNIPAKIPNMEDALLSDLSLRYEGNDVAVLATPIRFANCSVHTSCTSCVKSDSECHWCPFTFKCIASRDEACSESETAVISSCPRILPAHNSFDYPLHTDFIYRENPLVINAQNLSEFSESFSRNEFQCVIARGGKELFRMPARLRGNMVECERQQFAGVLEAEEREVKATLNVEWVQNNFNIDNPNNARVIFYSCPRLGTNCAECLAIPDDYQCQYCGGCGLEEAGCEATLVTGVRDCSHPFITSVTPSCGPADGGTMVTVEGSNLGTIISEINSVNISNVACQLIDQSYQPGVSFNCTTGEFISVGSYQVNVNFTYLIIIITGGNFVVKTPSLSAISPTFGPQSGGTMVTITGSNLDIGSKLSVTIFGQDCYVMNSDEDEVTCISSGSTSLGKGVVKVAIDNWSGVVDGTFEYLEDPAVDSITPDFAFISGGTEYTVVGQNLNIVSSPRLLVHLTISSETQSGGRRRRRRQTVQIIKSQPCTTDAGGTRMSCLAPPITTPTSDDSPLTAVLGLEMDGVDSLRRLDNEMAVVYSNPRFERFSDQSFSNNEEIQLTVESQGSEFKFTSDQVMVLLTPCDRMLCECIDITLDNTSFACLVESTSGLDRGSDITVTVHIGNFNQTVGTITIEGPPSIVLIIVLSILASLVAAALVCAVIVGVFCYKTRQKDSRYKELIVEMEKLESSVARECKLGFAELQTDLDELTGDISGHRLPYRDLQVYLLATLFPGSKDHPVLHPVQLPLHRQISCQRAIRDFSDLCMDKKVLLTFIRTLEEQRSFTIRDKSIVGSLLMVILHSRLDYATEVLKTLLSDQITRTVSKHSPKMLLRRTESVAEKMLTNWLAFCLHGYIVEQAGKPLYLLYRAVKNQLEKGPIDVITGEARYSLSEHKLIRQKMDVQVLTVTVEADDGVRVPVKVLDCDTISQVKEKMLDIIYKATPVSKRPSLTSIDLEHITSPHDYHLLRDEDMSMVTEGDWKKLNTLQHYSVSDGATFRLMKRNSHAPPGQSYDYPASLISSHAVRNRALSEAEDGTRVWHLFKQHDMEDPRRSPFMNNKKMITEVYLPRMLSTKNILQKFVDDLFSGLFSVTHSPTSPGAYNNCFPLSPGSQVPMSYAPGGTVPMAVKYLLDFLDGEAAAAQITEEDVVHTWKNNALALRFWVNMMKNPEFFFDINKSHTVDACLSIIASAFIDGCSYADVKLTIDSPTNKLLYNKEVQEYKKKVKVYYQSVARLPRIPEDAMQSYLKQLSEHQSQVLRNTGGFVVESALYELLRYGNKYSNELVSNLNGAGLYQRAQVFESVVRATMTS